MRLIGAEAMRIPLACRAGLGLVFLTFLLILLGILHLFIPPVMIGVWLVWLAGAIFGYFQVRRESFFTEAFPHGDPSWNPLFLRIGIGVMLLICLICTMTPETRHDPYDYHLTIPNLYLAYHSIVEIPWHVFTYMPKNCEILYGLALGVGNDSLAKVIHFNFGCLCILSIASFIKRIAGHEASMLAALLTVTLPLFGFIATASYIDLARSFWELSALYMLYQVWDESESRTKSVSFILSGFFAGMALGTKYVSSLVFFPPYLLLAALTFWKWRGVSTIRRFSFWIPALVIPIAPWLMYNLIWTGNPIYPLFPSLFGAHVPPAMEAYEFIRNHAPNPENLTWHLFPGYLIERIASLLLDGNALVLIGIVAWAASAWSRTQSIGQSLPSFAWRGLLIYTVLSTLLFIVGCENRDGRFFFSTMALLAIPSVFLLYALSYSIRQSSPWGRYVIPGFALILFANAATYRFNQMKDLQESPLPILSNTQRDHWLNRRFTYYKAVQWAEHNLSSDTTTLGMGYPLSLKHIARIKYGYIPFFEGVEPGIAPEALSRLLKDNGITHIVKPYIEPAPGIDLSILENGFMKLVHSSRDIEIYELLPDSSDN